MASLVGQADRIAFKLPISRLSEIEHHPLFRAFGGQ
jgi:hypothetical protein